MSLRCYKNLGEQKTRAQPVIRSASMDKRLICLLVCFTACPSSVELKKTGCFSYEKTGRVVAGGNGVGPALNQFFSDRFYVDDSQNIYLLDRSSSSICEWRFVSWPANRTQGSLITKACVNGVPSSLQDVLVGADGKYKVTGLGFGADAVAQVRRVNGQNSMALWSSATVDNEKNVYTLGYSESSHLYELRKWTATTGAGQSGVLIDSSQSIREISDFFVDSKGSVYTVGLRYNSVRKWTNGEVKYLTRNGKLNRPTTVLVDSEENIFIAEYNQITVWPANSNESLSLISVNQSNGLVVDNNYKNIIQMDNNGSLYLLSTDRAVFGTKILKYRCNSK